MYRISYKLLVFGHRNLTKNVRTQTGVMNILKICILNLTFRVLVNIDFQIYMRAVVMDYLKPSGKMLI